MINSVENYTRFPFDTTNTNLPTRAGASLLTETVDLAGLSHGLQTMNRCTPDTEIHRGAKILSDMTTMIALSGDCLQDIDLLRTSTGQHTLFS